MQPVYPTFCSLPHIFSKKFFVSLSFSSRYGKRKCLPPSSARKRQAVWHLLLFSIFDFSHFLQPPFLLLHLSPKAFLPQLAGEEAGGTGKTFPGFFRLRKKLRRGLRRCGNKERGKICRHSWKKSAESSSFFARQKKRNIGASVTEGKRPQKKKKTRVAISRGRREIDGAFIVVRRHLVPQ